MEQIMQSACSVSSCCPAGSLDLPLEQALDRFEREAERGVCDTGRYRCRYYVWGSGPPLLFIHGLSDTSSSFVLPIARLSQRFRCIAYDLPTGQGDGACLARTTHASLVEDLFALLDHLNQRRSYVFGSSFGSTIALVGMHQRPDRLPRAILQGSFARRPLAPAELLLARMARYWPWPLRYLPFRKEVLIRADQGPFQAGPTSVWQYYLANSGATAMAAVATRALLMHRLDLRALLPEIRQPILMLCGDRDPAVGRACEDDLLHGLPNVGRVEFANCGHFPYFTHPAALAEMVGRFLTPPPSCAA